MHIQHEYYGDVFDVEERCEEDGWEKEEECVWKSYYTCYGWKLVEEEA